MKQQHVVYVFLTSCGRYAKIGVTTDLERRVKSVQTGCPLEIRVKRIVVCDSRSEAYRLEKRLHQICADAHKHGEWFIWMKIKDRLTKSVIGGRRKQTSDVLKSEPVLRRTAGLEG